MSTFEIQHFKNQELAKAYMQGVHDITEWLLKPREREATNFDKLTASPEALAKFIIKKDKFKGVFEADCFFKKTKEWRCLSDTCEECITKWLKQKAEDEK